MREKDLIDAMNRIQVKPAVKERVMTAAGQQAKTKSAAYFRKAIAAAFILLMVGFLGFGDLPFLSSRQQTELFPGFAITAYNAYGEEIALSPNVATPLGKYSPQMSSVPGFPIQIGWNDPDLEIDEIQVKVDHGTISTWDTSNGIVEEKGNLYLCQPGETVYWSPLTADGSLITRCNLTIAAIKDGSEIGKVEMQFKGSDDGIYSIVYLRSYPILKNN